MATARLHYSATCPNIVAAHGICVDTFEGHTTHNLVMERLAGSMTQLLLTPGGAHYGADMGLRLALLADVAVGLAYLHADGIIHADLKPHNVLLTAPTRRFPNPAAKLADFGSSVARRTGAATRSTLRGARGTYVYMDPRLFDPAASITAASDVHSFGVTAWQVLTALNPYYPEVPPDDDTFLMRHVVGGGRPVVAALTAAGVPRAVVDLLQRCWAPAQEDRPAMKDVQRVLEAAAEEVADAGDGAPVAAPSPSVARAPVVLPPAPAPAPPAPVVPVPVPAPAADAPVTTGELAYDWEHQAQLYGHTEGVFSSALLPGGRLAVGESSGTARIWDVARGGRVVAVAEGADGQVRALAMHPDGRRLFAGVTKSMGRLGAVVVWDIRSVPPTRRATHEAGKGVASLAVLTPDTLAVGSSDGVIRVMDAESGKTTALLEGHDNIVAALVALAGGDRGGSGGGLASGGFDSMVRVWNVGARTCARVLAGHTAAVCALVQLVDGRLASGSMDHMVRLWDPVSGTCVRVLMGHTREVWALAALADGRLASGGADAMVLLWDTRPAAAGATRDDTPDATFPGHANTVMALTALPGGRLASSSRDNTVRLWQLPLARVLTTGTGSGSGFEKPAGPI